jgi:hypothetical protein
MARSDKARSAASTRCLQAHLAGLPEHGSIIGVGVLVEFDPWRYACEQSGQPGFALAERQQPEILPSSSRFQDERRR